MIAAVPTDIATVRVRISAERLLRTTYDFVATLMAYLNNPSESLAREAR